MSGSRPSTAAGPTIALVVLLTLAATGMVTPARADPATDSRQVIDQLNLLRQVAGLPVVRNDAALTAGAQAHARYTAESGQVGHTQDLSHPDATAAGTASAARSNVSLRISSGAALGPRGMTDQMHVSPLHGLLHLQPNLTTTGAGYARRDGREAVVIDVHSGLDDAIEPISRPIAFPGPGSATNLRSYDGGEYPDPLAPCRQVDTPSGAPILVNLPASVRATSVVVTGPEGQQQPICWYDADRYDSDDTQARDLARNLLRDRNALVVVPHDPLATGRHRVRLDLGDRGPATWSFRVGGSLQPATGWIQTPIQSNPRFEQVCPAASLPVLTFDDVAPGRHDHAIACGLRWDLLSGTSTHAFSSRAALTRGQGATLLHRLLVATDDGPVATSAVSFTDVRPDDVHAPAILALAARGIVNGRGDGTYGPGEPVTRAQFVAMLSAMLDGRFEPSEPTVTTSRFDDVEPDSLYLAAIEHLADLGVVAGVTEESFDPTSAVRRDHAASFLLRTAVLLADHGVLPPPD